MEQTEKTKRRAGRPIGTGGPGHVSHADRAIQAAEGRAPGGRVGVRLRPQHQEEVRQKIKSSLLVTYLQQHADGTREMSPTQIKAAEILLSKSLSSLQAVEVNNVSNNDKMSEAEIMERIAELVRANPALASIVGEARVVSHEPDGPSPGMDEPAACIVCGDAGMPGGCPGCGGDPSDDADDMGEGAPC